MTLFYLIQGFWGVKPLFQLFCSLDDDVPLQVLHRVLGNTRALWVLDGTLTVMNDSRVCQVLHAAPPYFLGCQLTVLSAYLGAEDFCNSGCLSPVHFCAGFQTLKIEKLYQCNAVPRNNSLSWVVGQICALPLQFLHNSGSAWGCATTHLSCAVHPELVYALLARLGCKTETRCVKCNSTNSFKRWSEFLSLLALFRLWFLLHFISQNMHLDLGEIFVSYHSYCAEKTKGKHFNSSSFWGGVGGDRHCVRFVDHSLWLKSWNKRW